MRDSFKEKKDLLKRVKILSIPYIEVLESIVSFHEIESVIEHGELPRGYLVTSVHYNYPTQTFNFLIIHESFDIVEAGAVIPHYDDVLKVQLYKVDPLDK